MEFPHYSYLSEFQKIKNKLNLFEYQGKLPKGEKKERKQPQPQQHIRGSSEVIPLAQPC